MPAAKSTGMLLDGVFASEAIDSSGEVVSISGMDITTMEEGHGVANYEHLGEDGGYGREVVGKIIYVRKVLKESDCENDRQRSYWEKLKGIPFLYGVVRLYDGAGHDGAKALAAMVRDHVANDEPILVRFSIEGTTTEKDGNHIRSSIAKKVALTLKPCNKTAVSGLVSDPNAPEDFPSVKKAETHFIDPEFRPLGGATVVEGNPCLDVKAEASLRLLGAMMTLKAVRKALTAGSPAGPPSSRTGGEALQREDLGRTVKNTALAALRDWGSKPFRRGEFRAFAKAKLPEVSDSFLDHFTDVAEAYTVKKALAKALPAQSRKTATPAAPKVARASVLEDLPDGAETDPDETITDVKSGKKRNIAVGTVRGKALTPNPGIVRPQFDAKKGVLHTPVGSFRASLPKHFGKDQEKHYHEILRHPEIEGAMDHAIENWSKVHRLLKAGKLPPEVVMHAVMFAQLSPNKPVPTQELQYARLVDAMDATGIDPRHPGFEDIEEPYRNLDHPSQPPHIARDEFKRNPSYYTGGKVGVDRDASGNIIGKPSKETGRYPGELLATTPLFNDFLSRASQYHKLHDHLVGIVAKHRHDILGGVGELMSSKQQATNWSNTRRTAIKAGKPDPGPFQGMAIPGIKVKTGLYTWGMMGGGNSMVPDTHFVRHMFGLDLNQDAETIEYLKQMLWRPTNMKSIVEPYNDWYSKNHPAVAYTLNHPKWGHLFADDPTQARFPAFWRHWLTIAPHEQALGLPNQSEQAGTTHAPYWEAIAPHVDPLLKAEGDTSIALRTALVHQQYVQDYGEVPALMMYYKHLVPHLLEAAEHRERHSRTMGFLTKTRQLEVGLMELRKSLREVMEGGPAVEAPEVHTVDLKVNGKAHPAGRFMVHDDKVTHLEDYHGVLSHLLPEGPVTATTVSRLHGMQFGGAIAVAPHASVVPPRPGDEAPQAPEGAAGEVIVAPQAAPPRPAVFDYHRPGLARPHVIEFGSAGAALDGQKLDDAELALMLQNVQGGIATLRYRSGGHDDADLTQLMTKAEDPMEPADALQHVRAAVVAGHVHPDVERALTRHIYEDRMVQGVGNKYAYQQFRAQGRPGVYLSMDANSFKHVNDTHGHDAGDAAISSMGGALRAAADKVGTGKLFRPGGDEFVAHLPTYEEAARFMRHAREHLDQLPPVNGVHRLTMSFGLGSDFPTADRALYEAKKQKLDPLTGALAFPPGRTPHFAHSLVPGTEGPIQMHTEQPPATSLPSRQPPARAKSESLG